MWGTTGGSNVASVTRRVLCVALACLVVTSPITAAAATAITGSPSTANSYPMETGTDIESIPSNVTRILQSPDSYSAIELKRAALAYTERLDGTENLTKQEQRALTALRDNLTNYRDGNRTASTSVFTSDKRALEVLVAQFERGDDSESTTPTATSTPTSTVTSSATPTSTATSTRSSTATSTQTVTATETSTVTATPGATPTPTPEQTATASDDDSYEPAQVQNYYDIGNTTHLVARADNRSAAIAIQDAERAIRIVANRTDNSSRIQRAREKLQKAREHYRVAQANLSTAASHRNLALATTKPAHLDRATADLNLTAYHLEQSSTARLQAVDQMEDARDEVLRPSGFSVVSPVYDRPR